MVLRGSVGEPSMSKPELNEARGLMGKRDCWAWLITRQAACAGFENGEAGTTGIT